MMSVIRKFFSLSLFFFFDWLVSGPGGKQLSINYLVTGIWDRLCPETFYFFLSECEVLQKVSASRYVDAPYHPLQTASEIIWHAEGTETSLSVSHWSHRAVVVFTRSQIIPLLYLKEAFQEGCRLRQPGAHERSGGCKSCVRWLCGERKHLPSIPLFD